MNSSDGTEKDSSIHNGSSVKLNNFDTVDIDREILSRKIDCMIVPDVGEAIPKTEDESNAEENMRILKAKIITLLEQNENLRNSLDAMNLAREEVVDKLKQVSVETSELIENCEKSSQETKLFKLKCEHLEEKLLQVNDEKAALIRENDHLRFELKKHANANDDKLMAVVDDANQVLKVCVPRMKQILETLDISDRSRIQLQQEVICLKEENENLRLSVVEKDALVAKQNAEFLGIKETVDNYQSHVSRLDAELKDCHLRVSTLNENLDIINAENLDLAEYTNFKSWLKKFNVKGDVDELLSRLQTLSQIEELFDESLAARVNNFVDDLAMDESCAVEVFDKNADVVNRIKNYLEKALYAIEKLNEKHARSRSEYENIIRTKNDENATLKEVLNHYTLYNEILEQTLKQCRDNAKMDKFVEEKTDQLIAANKALHDNFLQLRNVYRYSHRFNDQLFAKFKQLSSWCRILKINVEKLNEPAADGGPNVFDNSRNLLRLMDELFREVTETNADYHRRNDCSSLLTNYEPSFATKDYLKSTVDNMTLEVKRLTCKVEQEMTEKIREIESLKGEMGKIMIDNRQLVNKIKSCNEEIISLSTENYDLNEKLSIFSHTGNSCEFAALEATQCNVRSSCREIDSDKFAQIRRLCVDLKDQHALLKRDALMYRTVFDEFARQTAEQVVCVLNANVTEQLSALQAKVEQLKSDHHQLRRNVYAIREQTCAEISSLSSNLPSFDTTNGQNGPLNNLDFCASLNDTVETAHRALSTKLLVISEQMQRLQSNSNAAIVNETRCKELIFSHSNEMLKITQELKLLRQMSRDFVETLLVEFKQLNTSARQNIQEAIAYAFDNVKSSIALSNEEVIKEMQDMNLELKKRGETISALNERVDEFSKEKHQLSQLLMQREKQTKDLNGEITDLQKSIVERDSQIKSLEEDLLNFTQRSKDEVDNKNAQLSDLRNALEKATAALHSKEEIIAGLENEIIKTKEMQTDGDVSSMGNISRTEEASRLRDVEDSFEERYMKLRCIAVRMKKDIADLKQQLKNEKAERAAIQNKLNFATEQAKRNQALQEECDRITDDLELKTNETKELKKIIAEADRKIQENETLSEQYRIVHDEKNKLETEIKNYISSKEELEKEKFVQETLRKEKEREAQQLRQKLKENEEYVKKVQNELEQANFEARKRGVLTLEMRDYEKTIRDLNEKLKKNGSTFEELNEKLKISTESNVSLIERIKQLEEQITSFGVSSKMADEQILNLNKSLLEHEKDLEAKDVLLKQLNQQLEDEKSKNESLVLQLAESISEGNSLKGQFKNKQESFNSQAKSLQNQVGFLEEKLKKKESEFDKLKEDFEAYKIRAHNALQKHKSENGTTIAEERLKVQVDDLSQTVKELRKRLEDTLIDLDNYKTELKLAEAAKEKLHLRMKEIQDAYAEKNRELDNTSVEFKSFKLNSDTLVKCYQNEIENLRVTCQKLNAELEDSKVSKERKDCLVRNENASIDENEHVSIEKSDNDARTKNNASVIASINNRDNSDQEKSRNHSLISLEKLLETDVTEENKVSGDIAKLRKNVESLENQITYLNGMLNESEKSAARNEQQVAWLKDENRRLQKTIDRAPHLQNGEYLKNVLFNFFTFPSGEEKCRLIAILETLLQLTAEETEILSSIAKGNRTEQKRTSGLSSFLKFG